MCMKSDNNTVKFISRMGVNGLYSVLGVNYRVPSTKYGMNLNIVLYCIVLLFIVVCIYNKLYILYHLYTVYQAPRDLSITAYHITVINM